MSFCTYIASDKPLSESDYLWPLSRGGEDIYTEKVYVAQIIPDLDDLSGVLSYIQNHLKTAEELEVWHIWQGVESEPVVRTQTVPAEELTADHILELQSRDVFATTTQYEIPVQYRIVIVS